MSTAVLPHAPLLTSPVAVPNGNPGFLRQSWIPYVILGSFVVLTLPLCVLAASSADFLAPWSLGWLYVCGLGTTHFALTLTIYLQSANLSYFNSSWSKRALYFLVPALIFVSFDLYRALQIAVLLPAVDLGVRSAIRFLDFQHFNRQSFGVFQLFKSRSKAFPGWLRRVESLYFFGLTVLLFLSFLTGGRFDGSNVWTRLVLLVVGGLAVPLVVGYVQVWRSAGERSALYAPLGYFLLQSLSAVLAIANTAFYLCCLAMHYVEYHVLMYPRCFNAQLNPANRTDRLFGLLRSRKLVFYSVLLGVAALVTYCTWLGMGMLVQWQEAAGGPSYLVLISLFDGLFVFHYFIESLIWKFSDPHYRQTLGPLYFGK
jgi:hypothetical protein